MKITTTPQSQSFNANVLVHFTEPPSNIAHFAKSFVIENNLIPFENIGTPFPLGDGRNCLIPDKTTSLAAILSIIYDGLKKIDRTTSVMEFPPLATLSEELRLKVLEIVAKDKETIKETFIIRFS